MTLTEPRTSATTFSRIIAKIAAIGPARLSLVVIGVVALLMAVWPSIFSPYSPSAIDASSILVPPSFAHPLGTDEAGADVWARLVYSTRLELVIAAGSVLVALVIGLPTGLIAGNAGRFLDGAFTSVASATLAFPLVLFAILMVASFGTTSLSLTVIIGFLFFPRVFLLMRAQTRSLKEREFVTALRVGGVRPAQILGLHVLPNSAGPLLTLIPTLMAEAILIEAGLSYLGLGVDLPASTWGTILEASKNYYVTSPWYAISAGLVITFVAAVLMFAGELIAESANPMRRRHRS